MASNDDTAVVVVDDVGAAAGLDLVAMEWICDAVAVELQRNVIGCCFGLRLAQW